MYNCMKNVKAAIPEFSGRISPMFDVAAKFHLFNIKDSSIADEQILNLAELDEFSKIRELCKENVSIVICDSISLCAAGHIVCSGLKLFPNNNGKISEVIEKYISGELKTDREFFEKRPCKNRKRHGNRQKGNRCKNIYFEDII